MRIKPSLIGLVFAVYLAANTTPAVAQVGSQKLPALGPPLSAPKIQTPQLQAPQLQPLATRYAADAANPGFQGSANAGGVAWQCAGGKCSASGPAATPTVQACSELARTVGALRSFAYGQSALGPNELGQCNAAVAVAPQPGIGSLGMMPQGPMGAVPQAPVLSPGTPPPPPGTPSSAGPGLKRLVTIDDFAPLALPLPAPQRVTPPTPSTKPSGTPPITDPAQNPIVSAAPLMAMPELRPAAPVPGKTISLQAPAAPLTPPATKPAATPKPQPDDAQKPPPAATPAPASTPQASAPGDSKAAPPAQPPPPAKTEAPTAPGPRSYPVSISTALTITGTGAAVTVSAGFTPRTLRTALAITGTGAAVTVSAGFTPRTLRTALTITGTGGL